MTNSHSAIVCVTCSKIVAVGSHLPAVCLAAIPQDERRAMTKTEIEQHPDVHRNCIELQVVVPAELQGAALLEEVERVQREAIAALKNLEALSNGA